MIRPARAVVFGAALSLLLLGTQLNAASHASAQWLPDRAYTEGPGFRVGNLELHPGVALRAGFDSNVFRQPGTTSNPEVKAGLFGVTPHLHLSTLHTLRRAEGEDAAGAAVPTLPPVAFDVGVAGTYFQYFATKNKSLPKSFEVDLDGAMSVLPDRKFGFDVGATYARTIRPFTASLPGNSNVRYALDRVRPSLTIRGQSAGGVLKGRIGFAPALTMYEGSAFQYLNQNQYEVPAGLAWKFLPSTALLFDGSYSFNDYTKPGGSGAGQRTILLSDSQRFQARVGVNGAITPNLGIRLLVGYAATVQKVAALDDHEDVVGEAALTFAWSRRDSLEGGYQRSLDAANLGGWTQIDRGYLKFGTLLGGRFSLNIDGGVAHVNYGRLVDRTGQALGVNQDTSRQDIRIDGGVHGEVRATNWLAFLADFSALATLTDFKYDRGAGIPVYPGQFKSFQAYGGVRAHY